MTKSIREILREDKERTLRVDPPEQQEDDVPEFERRQMTRRDDDLERQADAEQLTGAMADAFEIAMRRTMADEKFMSSFWEKAYEHVTTKASSETQKWVGSRVLTWIVTAALTICIGFLINRSLK
jgi:hypothetical protein